MLFKLSIKLKTLISRMQNKLSLCKVKFNTTVRLDEFMKEEKKNIYIILKKL